MFCTEKSEALFRKRYFRFFCLENKFISHQICHKIGKVYLVLLTFVFFFCQNEVLTGLLHEQYYTCAYRSLANHRVAWRLSTFRTALLLVNGRQAQVKDCPCRGPVNAFRKRSAPHSEHIGNTLHYLSSFRSHA